MLFLSRDNSSVEASLKRSAYLLLDVIEKHSNVIIDVTVADESSNSWSTSDVFDAAISLQMRYVDLTRHVVILTGNCKRAALTKNG